MHHWYRCHWLVFALLSWSFLPGCYSFRQVYHQGNLLSRRQPIKQLIWSDQTPEELRKKLRLTEEILQFADQNGLSVGSSYRYYIDTTRDAVSYLVQAAPEFSLIPKTWKFPLVGKVPYLGFYDLGERDAAAQDLEREGLDVYRGSAEAFSLLGWMDDPLFSSMLKRSPTSLAHLLFHELTHRTIWIKGDVALNENLAEWVAIHLTTKFIQHRNEDPKAYEAYLGDRDLFASWVAELKAQLQSRYEAFDASMTIEQRREEKARIFRIFTRDKRPKFRAVDFLKSKDFVWNNAAVIAHSLYLPDRTRYEAAYKCSASQSVGQFLGMVAKHMKGDQALKNLDQLCRPGSMIPS